MDILFIHELRIDTVIGAYDWERRMAQTVCLDLELAADIRPAAAGDALDRALDYAAVADRVQTFVAQSRFRLIETLAERTAALVMEEFGVTWLRLTVRKPGAVRGAREAGVTIERSAPPPDSHPAPPGLP